MNALPLVDWMESAIPQQIAVMLVVLPQAIVQLDLVFVASLSKLQLSHSDRSALKPFDSVKTVN